MTERMAIYMQDIVDIREELNWRVIFVPTKKMRDLMEKESHKPWNKRP